MDKNTKKEKEKTSEPSRLDELLLMYNLRFSNQLELDVHKLLITLSTGAIVLSVSLLKIFPLSKITDFSYYLMWSWYFFGFSILSGTLSLVIKSRRFERNFLTDRALNEKYQKDSFKDLTEFLKISGRISARIQEVSFVIAIVLMIIFATKAIKM